MKRVLTGIQSTGTPHLGNVLGAMAPAIDMSNDPENEAFLFIADMHSLTTIRDPKLVHSNTMSAASAWLALGFDIEKNMLYRQSDLPQVAELMWYLNCLAPYPMLANAHSFKDRQDRLSEVNGGLFTYPVLMAADILLYDAQEVPVGKDQQQHLEITRDLAESFNRHYGKDMLVVPEAVISEQVKIVPGTDGQKMSKSYGNFISIFGSEKVLKKQVMGIITDSTPMEEPKNPDICNVFKIFELVASKDDVAALRRNYENGNFGYGHAKKALLEVLIDRFGSARADYNNYMNNQDEVEAKLKFGAEKAGTVATATLRRIRQAVGYNPVAVWRP